MQLLPSPRSTPSRPTGTIMEATTPPLSYSGINSRLPLLLRLQTLRTCATAWTNQLPMLKILLRLSLILLIPLTGHTQTRLTSLRGYWELLSLLQSILQQMMSRPLLRLIIQPLTPWISLSPLPQLITIRQLLMQISTLLTSSKRTTTHMPQSHQLPRMLTTRKLLLPMTRQLPGITLHKPWQTLRPSYPKSLVWQHVSIRPTSFSLH